MADKVYLQLRQDIVGGALAPSQPLRLDGLKQRYGVGFSPIREALNRLGAERLVVSAPSRGFSVAPLSLDRMWDTIETRILVETRALRYSISKGDDEWESRVVSSLHALTLQTRRMGALEAPAEGEELELEVRHSEFHLALISACQSEWLLDFSSKLYVASERYRYPALKGNQSRRQSSRDIEQEHLQLAEAVTSRDADLATELLERHFRLTGNQVEHNFMSHFPDTV